MSTRFGRNGMKRLIVAIGAAAGLLALGVPVAQASTRSAATPSAAAASAAAASAASGASGSQQLSVGQLNPYTARYYSLAAPYSGCTFAVGDRYEGSGGAAVGMATISCPSPHTYRILVYLDYHDYSNGQEYTYRSNTRGAPYYEYGLGVWTGCATNVSAYWTTYARISIDGSAYSGFFKSQSNQLYSAGPNCP